MYPRLIGSLGSGFVIYIKTISSTFSPPSQGACGPGPCQINADNKPCLFILVVAINYRRRALQLSQQRQDVRLDLGWNSTQTQSCGCSGQSRQRGSCHKRFPARVFQPRPVYQPALLCENEPGDCFHLNLGPFMRLIEHESYEKLWDLCESFLHV